MNALHYDTVESYDENWLERIDTLSLRFKIYEYEQAHRYLTACIPFTRYVYLLAGEAIFYVDDLPVLRAKARDVVYIPAEIAYSSQWSDHVSLFVADIRVREPVGNARAYGDEIRLLFEDRSGTVEQSIHQLQACSLKQEGYRWMESTSLVLRILCDISRLQSDDALQQSRIYHSVLYIRYNYEKEISTAELARICAYSESQFRRLFKKYIGVSPIEYRNLLRIHRAEEMMRSQNLTVAQAAEKVGFSDVNYFYRFYKKSRGYSPVQSRRTGCAADPQN